MDAMRSELKDGNSVAGGSGKTVVSSARDDLLSLREAYAASIRVVANDHANAIRLLERG